MDPLNPASGGATTTPDPPGTSPHRRRTMWVALVVIALVAVSALALTQGKTADPGTANAGGGTAAPFTLDNIRPGQPPLDLAAMRGKPVVVNFWASWCGPCRREMPGFEAVYEAVGDRVAFLGIDNKDFRESALDFLRQTGARYPSGSDPAGDTRRDMGSSGCRPPSSSPPTAAFSNGGWARSAARTSGRPSADCTGSPELVGQRSSGAMR